MREDAFNCLGPYSDAEATECTELRFMAPAGHEMLRAFKTTSLRGAMHAGQIATLEEVIAHYAAAPDAPAGHSELAPLDLDEVERRQIAAFLASLEHPATGEDSELDQQVSSLRADHNPG